MGQCISKHRTEWALVRQAQQLGCTVEELLGQTVDMPEDQLGRWIGKRGKHIQEVQDTTKVSIQVVRNAPVLHIVGPLQSLNATAQRIDQFLAIVEETVELSPSVVSYLTTKGIDTLEQVRGRHPSVDLRVSSLPRKNPSSSSTLSSSCRISGVPEDVASAKQELQRLDLTEQEWKITHQESAIVIGKQGGTIQDLVERHQAAIQVIHPPTTTEEEQQEENEEEDTKTNKKKNAHNNRIKTETADTRIVVRGPLSNVQEAREEIEDLLAQHKELTQVVPMDPVVKELMLAQKGKGMQALYKLVNQGCRDASSSSSGGTVSVAIEQGAVQVRAKAIVMDQAVELVQNELRLQESSIVRLEIHASAIPALIGKSGAGIQQLKQNQEHVTILMDRHAGTISIGSFQDPSATETVAKAVRGFLQDNQVQSIELDPLRFQSQFRTLLRSKYWKELNELVTVSTDDELFLVLLRGKEENLVQARALVDQFLQDNFHQELALSENDIRALLKGGKKSKISELSKAHSVKLTADHESFSVTMIGKKDNVESVQTAIHRFLKGGDGFQVLQFMVDDFSAGVLVGKRGNAISATETAFPTVSIAVMPNNAVTLRGPNEDVAKCHKHMIKQLTITSVTVKEPLDEPMRKKSDKPHFRDLIKLIPISFAIRESEAMLRGCRADVYHALALLKDVPGSVYENRVFLEASCMTPFNKGGLGDHLSRIQSSTRTRIKVDTTTSSLIFSGRRTNVVTAKTQLLKMLGFLLGDRYACESLPDERAMKLLSHSDQLAHMSESSGAFVYVDRDIGALVMTSANAACVKAACEVLHEKLSSLDAALYQIQLGDDAEWMVPRLIGKNGSRIKSLRKSFACSVEVSDKSVTLQSVDPDILEKAKVQLDQVLSEERATCFVAKLSDKNMMSFMGPKGSHIMEFEKEHEVKAQVLRKPSGSLRITGDQEAVAKAKAALEEWLIKQEQENNNDSDIVLNFEESDSLILRRLIGKNGSRIKELRKRCKCGIEIELDKRTIKISSDDVECQESAKAAVEEILAQERAQNALVRVSENELPAFIGVKGSNIREFEKTHQVRVQVLKTDDGGDGLHISGEEEHVTKATAAFREWEAATIAPSVLPSEGAEFLGDIDDIDLSAPVPDSPVSDANENRPPVPATTNTAIRPITNKPLIPTFSHGKSDFPMLSVRPKEPDATADESGEKTVNVSSMTITKPGPSWSSIVQNPSKESTCSTSSKSEEVSSSDNPAETSQADATNEGVSSSIAAE